MHDIIHVNFQELVKPLFYTRMRLGEFDPPHLNPYRNLDLSIIQSAEHRELAIYAATQSFVLMKNLNNFLPLKQEYSNIAVSIFTLYTNMENIDMHMYVTRILSIMIT